MLGGIRGRSTPSICAAVLLAAAAIAGCGSDDEESAANDGPKFAAANEPADVFARRMANLLETTSAKKDCPQLEEINARSFTRFSCPPEKGLRESMASFEIVGSQDYGTGAVVDYKSGKIDSGAAILLFVAPDRNWGISRFGILTEPSTETDDEESRDGYAQAVDDYLTAVRRRDCAAFKKVAFLGEAKKQDVCKTLFAATEPLAKRLKANPSAEPAYEGGNDTYGFHTLETQKPQPENSTISVVRAAGEPDERFVILDVTPSPTAAAQRLVREQFRQQKQESRQPKPETSPSRKAK